MVEREEQKQKTRRKLIDAALRLSATKGLGALSLREVTKEAGITPSAFYRHFHDLEDLGLALMDEVGLSLRQLLREGRRNLPPEGDVVRETIEIFVGYVVENANLFRIVQGERQGASRAYRKALYEEIGRFVEEVAGYLDEVHGRVGKPLADSAIAAEAIVAVVFFVGGEALDLPRHLRPALIDRLVKVVKTILRGALLRPAKP
jgi:AcrR family transcriptional regulator